MAYFFAGPVEKKNNIIGDFGITIYFGKNKKIIDHLTICYQITKEVFSHAEAGMKLSDITKRCTRICGDNNLINTIESSTDPTGTNIGHTVPSTERGWTSEENEIFKNGPWGKVCKQISNRRIFLNESEQAILTKGMGITIEPRPRNKNDATIPMVSFHTIGLFYENGKKEQLTNFDDIFELVGMDYMLK
ncbi:MAG: M24 family metallopeptidase [Patescibacteria group bacterium]|mgnify:CR=1 FL=1